MGYIKIQYSLILMNLEINWSICKQKVEYINLYVEEHCCRFSLVVVKHNNKKRVTFKKNWVVKIQIDKSIRVFNEKETKALNIIHSTIIIFFLFPVVCNEYLFFLPFIAFNMNMQLSFLSYYRQRWKLKFLYFYNL